MVDTFAVSVRLAGLLLLHESQVTIRDIEALPFVSSRQEADAVAQKLINCFSTPGNKIELFRAPGDSDVRLLFVGNGKADHT